MDVNGKGTKKRGVEFDINVLYISDIQCFNVYRYLCAMSAIYLDYNATTPVDREVLEAMMPWFSQHFANAASRSHLPGRKAGEAVEHARESLARFIGASAQEIVFTSGSTESINLALKGAAEIRKNIGNHIITWTTEHKAVLDTCKRLEQSGFSISILPVGRDGLPDLDLLQQTMTDQTILVVMMMVNNETGVIMPVSQAAAIAHSKNALFFSDATQATGKIPVNVNGSGIDMLCLSAHKMYGPKGTGLLYLRRKNPRVTLSPLFDGGGHENGLRPGTLNVPGIIGMQKAAELIEENHWEETAHISSLRTLLEQQLTEKGRAFVNGSIRHRVCNTTNLCFPGIKASELITRLPQLAFSTGSACSSALPSPSHVLLAMGLSESEAYASVRLSLGRMTTEEEIESTAKEFGRLIG